MNLVAMSDIPALYAERLGRDHLCIVHQDDHLSWGGMATRVNRRASALKRLGIRQDDIMALVLTNENSVFELSFALWKLAATPSSLSDWKLVALGQSVSVRFDLGVRRII